MKNIISRTTIDNSVQLNQSFTTARFFPHVALTNFFQDDFCRGLLKEFPLFEERFAKNEYGKVGTKACVEAFAAIGPHYKMLDNCVQSKEFLSLLSQVTGIPDLLYDPEYFGGGTHENINNAELDPHVDFNYHPSKNWHRRLNLIIFLNEAWQEKWGGIFEVHKDPWSEEENEIEQVLPLFNNGVIFETNEYSWHGFNKVTLPENNRHNSRKSIALYFYTKERPKKETAASHGTIYVQRQLPRDIVPNETLTQENYALIKTLLKRRDQQIKYLYDREMMYSRQISTLKKTLAKRILPVTGYVAISHTNGVYHDQWVGDSLSFSVTPEKNVESFTIKGWLPSYLSQLQISIHCNGCIIKKTVTPGEFQLMVNEKITGKEKANIKITCQDTFTPSSVSNSGDVRHLSFIIRQIAFTH